MPTVTNTGHLSRSAGGQCLLRYIQNNNRQNQQTNCNFSINLVPSLPPFLPASSSHISHSLIHFRSDEMSSIWDSLGWLSCTHTHTYTHTHTHTLPLLEWQVSSSGVLVVASVSSSSSTVRLWRNVRPPTTAAVVPLLCGMCQCGRNLCLWWCHCWEPQKHRCCDT